MLLCLLEVLLVVKVYPAFGQVGQGAKQAQPVVLSDLVTQFGQPCYQVLAEEFAFRQPQLQRFVLVIFSPGFSLLVAQEAHEVQLKANVVRRFTAKLIHQVQPEAAVFPVYGKGEVSENAPGILCFIALTEL